jgi:PAS domain S-box-containing protein
MTSSDSTSAKEELTQALAELERSREREQQLRVEAEMLVAGLGLLDSTEERTELFTQMATLFRGAISFDDSFVLRLSADGLFRPITWLSDHVSGSVWRPGALFERVLNGEVVATSDIREVSEWMEQPEPIREGVRSALHASIHTERTTAVMICTHASEDHFSQRSVQLAEKFAPLAAQALVTIERGAAQRQKARLQEEHESLVEQQSLLTKVTEALSVGLAVFRQGEPLDRVSPVLEKMASPWGSVERWWDEVVGTTGAELAAAALETGMGLEVDLQTSGNEPRVFRLVFSLEPTRGSSAGLLMLVKDVTSERLAERERRESEEHFTNIFEQSNDGIILFDLDGTVADANPKILTLLQYSKSDFCREKHLPALQPESDVKKAERAFEKVTRVGQHRFDVLFMREDGTTFPADVSGGYPESS